MQCSLCFVEMWCCIVMSLEKCMILGNKGVVARGGVGWQRVGERQPVI